MSAALELRVLDGLHAGARAALPAGPELKLAIGSALDNDIVLSDPGIEPRHAVLLWQAERGRWQLLRMGQAEAGAGGDDYRPGEAALLGPIRVTVVAANDPFDLTAAPPMAPEPEIRDDEVRAEPAADEAASPAAEAGAEAPGPDEATARAAASPGASRPWLWVLLLGALALLALVAVALALFARGAAPPAPAAAAPVDRSVADLRATVAGVLRQQGLDGRLQLQGHATQATVQGLLADDSQLEPLAAALSRLNPRPRLQVWTVDQVRAAARDAGLRWPATVALGLADSGALRVSGALPSDEAEAALLQALRSLLPPFVAVQGDFVTPASLAQRFIAEAREQGFALDGQVQGRRLQLSATVAAAELPRWERWLVQAQARLAGLLTLNVQLRTPEAAAAAPRRLPFRVASVVGGERPHLLLDDGTKLAPGGRREGYTLVQIDDDALVLQGTGPAFKVPR
ncbi:MAG: type III secretion system inner membrane ring subunit SctD [Rubrivivax sp.]|nr:type III secretion system inner membrane ring subunit SctD [Rubrivivax sp.]